MKNLFFKLSIVGIFVITGCATSDTKGLKQGTTGQIGCDQEEIEISKEKLGSLNGYNANSWEAKCRGHHFFCSASSTFFSCKEELPLPVVEGESKRIQ